METIGFVCPRCLTASAHPRDAQERYCARCHAFVDDPVRHICRQCGTTFLARWDCPPICPDCFLVSKARLPCLGPEDRGFAKISFGGRPVDDQDPRPFAHHYQPVRPVAG